MVTFSKKVVSKKDYLDTEITYNSYRAERETVEGVRNMKISTTITRKNFETKMQDLKEFGCFFEYKDHKPFWKTRLDNLLKVYDLRAYGFRGESPEIVFLVGKEPHRFKLDNILFTNNIPGKYKSAIKTEWAYALKCVRLSDAEAAQVIATNLEKAGFKANIKTLEADIHWLREKGLVEE